MTIDPNYGETPLELGIVAHAETVRIHCFVDGNGRTTRLFGNLVFLAAQDQDSVPEIYDWTIEKREYIGLLRQYDITRDPKPLARFVPVHRITDDDFNDDQSEADFE